MAGARKHEGLARLLSDLDTNDHRLGLRLFGGLEPVYVFVFPYSRICLAIEARWRATANLSQCGLLFCRLLQAILVETGSTANSLVISHPTAIKTRLMAKSLA